MWKSQTIKYPINPPAIPVFSFIGSNQFRDYPRFSLGMKEGMGMGLLLPLGKVKQTIKYCTSSMLLLLYILFL
jgi:hypothetical protein